MFDYLPDLDLKPLLIESIFLPCLFEYLQNDSLIDIFGRSVVYFKILALLELLSGHETTIPLLTDKFPTPDPVAFHEHKINSSSASDQVLIIDDDRPTKRQKPNTPIQEKDSYTTPIVDIMKSLVTQASILSKSVSTIQDDHTDKENINLIMISNELCDLWNKISSRIEGYKTIQTPVTLENDDVVIIESDDDFWDIPEISYVETMKPRLFEYKTLWTTSNPAPPYTDNSPMSNNHTMHIAKEMATLSTSLPCSEYPSIFVRADDSNMTHIKCMITGPADTPYSYGCFEFNITFPHSYPSVSPKVLFMTTGKGMVRFNPNLYACGKVCLSLLGTWPGAPSEQWQTGKNQSTLLQVLTSIQSMILNETPYYNEPGTGKINPNSMQSMNYNRVIRRNCVKYAMVGVIKNPPVGFEDVVKDHFRMKKNEILEMVEQWAREDTGWNNEHVTDAASFANSRKAESTRKESHAWRALINELKALIT